MRESFVFYRSFYEALADLSQSQQTKVLMALCEYALNEKEPELTGAPSAVFKLIRPQVDANNKKYENGKKGGRPVKHSKEETAEAKKARQSTAYKNWQKAVFDRDGYECQMCGSKDDLQAHHKLDFIEFPSLRYELQNGITLCRTCHNKVHKKPSDNQEQTENKPKKTKSKPNVNVNVNVNDNVNENVNVNDNDNDNDNGAGSVVVVGCGDDRFNICKLLGADGIDQIYDAYPNSGGFLLDEVGQYIRDNHRIVKKPVGYVLAYAKNVGWDDDADHFDGGGMA